MSPAPILNNKNPDAPSVFEPAALLREARRQKALSLGDIPAVCVLDPDGDIVRRLKGSGQAKLSDKWPCYHTELYEFSLAGKTAGIIGCAVGAPFAVLVAEELFASGCRLLISITSAGQIIPAGKAGAPRSEFAACIFALSASWVDLSLALIIEYSALRVSARAAQASRAG